MRRPGVEQAGHEHRQAVENPLRSHSRLRLRAASLRHRRGLHDPLHERLGPGLEHAVELAHAGRAPRPPALERLGKVHHLGRLRHEPQPRQTGRQPRQQPLPAPRQHDPLGITTTRQRHIEHHRADEPAAHEGQLIPRRFRLAREHRRKQPANRCLARAASRRRRLTPTPHPGPMQPRRQDPERLARLQRRLDHLLGGGISVPPQLIELGGRHPRRRRGIATGHRGGRADQRASQPPHRMPPAGNGIDFGLRRARARRRIARAPRHHRIREQPKHAHHEFGRTLHCRHARQRRAATAFHIEHATIDAVVSGVAPDHRLVGRRHTFLAAVIVIRLFVGEVVMETIGTVGLPRRPPAIPRFATGRGRLDHVGHTAGVGLDQLDKPADAEPGRL